MERMTTYRLEWFMGTNNVNLNVISGFRQGRSPIDGVVHLVSSIALLAAKRGYIVVVFLDIKRTFDSITHGCIFTALIKLGIGERR